MVEIILDRTHLRLTLRYVHSRFQASDGEDAGVTCPIVQNQRIELTQRCVNIGLTLGRKSGEAKSGRSNSDNRVIHSINGHYLACYFMAAGETLPPQTIADDSRRRPTALIFLHSKFPSQRHLYSQSAEKMDMSPRRAESADCFPTP